jgi:hypothetical protein
MLAARSFISIGTVTAVSVTYLPASLADLLVPGGDGAAAGPLSVRPPGRSVPGRRAAQCLAAGPLSAWPIAAMVSGTRR